MLKYVSNLIKIPEILRFEIPTKFTGPNTPLFAIWKRDACEDSGHLLLLATAVPINILNFLERI